MADQQSSSTAAETSATTRPISCSSTNNDPKRSQGRPCKQAPTSENREVNIEGKEFALKTTRFDFKRESVLFSLCVPNRLLLEWQWQAKCPGDYVCLLNKKVTDQAVAVRCNCDRIAGNLARRAGSLKSRVTVALGRARENLLEQSFYVPVCEGETVSLEPYKNEIENLHVELANALVEMELRETEVAVLKQKMGQLLQEREGVVNRGKIVENVSARQQRCKLSHFRSVSEAALWFANSFGLVVDQITTHTVESKEQLTINFGSASDSQVSPQLGRSSSRVVDDFCAMQILYLLDRFGVSDEFYHELTQVCS